jgi:hypothetical protein
MAGALLFDRQAYSDRPAFCDFTSTHACTVCDYLTTAMYVKSFAQPQVSNGLLLIDSITH